MKLDYIFLKVDLKKFFFFLTALITSLGNPAHLSANVNYTATVIEAKEDIQDILQADFNGDTLGDIALIVWSDDLGRELLVYFQSASGQFSSTPSRRIEIKTDIIAMATGDVREQAGDEIIFFTRSASYSFSTTSQDYGNNLKKLFNSELINTVPHRKETLFLGQLQDYNADGKVDILLPGAESYAVYFGKGSDTFTEAKTLPKAFHNPTKANKRAGGLTLTIDGENGLAFSRSAPPSAFADILKDHPAQQSDAPRNGETNENILERRNWIPAVLPVKINQDELIDFAFIDDPKDNKLALQQLNLLSATKDGSFSRENHWKSEFELKDTFFFVDFTGDKLDDIYSMETSGNDQISFYFYVNKGGRFNLSAPDQVIKFSGYAPTAKFLDLNGDAIPEFALSYYAVSSVEALRGGSLIRNLVVYLGEHSGEVTSDEKNASVFSRRPSLKHEEKFSSNAFKGLSQPLIMDADINGDQIYDVVSIDNDGKLVAHSIDSALQRSKDPFWQFVPSHVVQEIITATLNTDRSSDFILSHQKSITVLVSRP